MNNKNNNKEQAKSCDNCGNNNSGYCPIAHTCGTIKDEPDKWTPIVDKVGTSSGLPKDIKDRQTEFLNSCRPKVEKSCVNCGQIKDERCRGRWTNVCENWTPTKADKVEE